MKPRQWPRVTILQRSHSVMAQETGAKGTEIISTFLCVVSCDVYSHGQFRWIDCLLCCKPYESLKVKLLQVNHFCQTPAMLTRNVKWLLPISRDHNLRHVNLQRVVWHISGFPVGKYAINWNNKCFLNKKKYSHQDTRNI